MMLKKIARWEAYHPRIVFIIALILLIPSFVGFLCTRVNYDILSYLPEALESVQGINRLDESFKAGGMSIIVVENMPAKYSEALGDEIEKIDGVESVVGVSSLLGSQIPPSILPDEITDILYSEDGKSTLMLVKYDHTGASDETMEAIKDIKRLLSETSFISGISALTQDTKELADGQAPIYIAVAIILALVLMSAMMESWILPFIVLGALGMAILYNMGTNVFLGEISFITQSIAAILQLGVTMDYSIFLIDRYHEEKRLYPDRRDAMASAVHKSFTALIGSSLTTVFGFIALCFMQLRLGFDIGFVMAKGVVFGILTVVLILPAILLLFEDYIDRYRHRNFIPSFKKANGFVIRHRAVFAVIFALLLIPAYLVQSNADKYYNLDRALPQDISSIQGLTRLKEDFNMASTQFLVVDDSLPASTLMEMEDEISRIDGVTSVIAYNTVLGPAVPDSIIPDEILSICKADGRQMIMVNSEYGAASEELNAQLETLDSTVKKYDATAMVTGEGPLTKDLMATTDRDFVVTGILSIAAIFLLIAICFKSVSIPILLVLSIELAIWINLALSTITGTTISFVDSTVINCVQLGATVDYAILLTTRFREELHTGISKKEAILNAADTASRSILQSSAVFFVATFGVYLICDIPIIKGICALLARGSIISAIVIIFLLPAVLYVCEGVIGKTTLGWKRRKTDNA